MTSGLEFDEIHDSRWMMYGGESSAAEYAANKELRVWPGSSWQYSSGTSALLSRLIRYSFIGTSMTTSTDKRKLVASPLAASNQSAFMLPENSMSNQAYWSFPRLQLFDVIGMRSAVMELDTSGTFIGGARMHATARDWARFGLLYANDGLWHRDNFAIAVLPQQWTSESVTRKPASGSRGLFGGHWWLGGTSAVASDVALDSEPQYAWLRQLPRKTLVAMDREAGHILLVVPEYHLVLVRFGFEPLKPAHVLELMTQLAELLPRASPLVTASLESSTSTIANAP